MALAIAGIEFDHHDYDERGDTLYLHAGPPREPARAIETPEGHTVEDARRARSSVSSC